jgi:aspartate-semialdehyde dehydrogenase
MNKYNVAIVGASGAVGECILQILAERKFPIESLHCFGSERSVGETVTFAGKPVALGSLEDFDPTGVDIAFFSAGREVSLEWAPKFAAAGAVVIDNTTAYRLDPDVPLVVPEVNAEALAQYTKKNIVANPNCSTIQLMVAVKPIVDAVGVTRINVATYQAVSGTGKPAIEELAKQTAALLNAQPIQVEVYPKQIAFNAIPHIDDFEDNGYTKEEMKIVNETRKILNDESIQINPTAVRIPVFYGHSEAVHLETKEKITAEKARKLLSKAPGVKVIDKHKNGGYPTAVGDASGKDPVFVGRIREDISHPLGLDMWVVADNIRKGAALNSIQIAEQLIQDYL